MSEPQHPTPPYAQPGYGHQPAPTGYPVQMQGYVAPGHPGPGYPAPTPTGSTGRTALIIAIVALVFEVIVTLATPFAFRGIGDTTVVMLLLNAVRPVIAFGLVLTALLLGILSIRRQAKPVLGGIAVGIAAAILIGNLAAMLSGLFFRIVMS